MATGTVALPSDDELAEGQLVGEYSIERVIGTGGMGTVYGARHPVIGKRAAIKVLNARYSADRESVQRFVQEAQAVNRIGHANIVDVFAFGTLPDGRQYMIMEWLQGESLQDRLERLRLTVPESISIIVALTRALEAAHAAGVIHRDLKPENVFLVPEDGALRVKLLDFGIAKLSTRTANASKTATGMTVGTPLFMSPEQARGLDIDARSDLYSLGCVAYAMVCGRTPFEDQLSAVEILNAHIHKPARPPSDFADVPPGLETVIVQLLAKQVDERPSLADVRRRLTAVDAVEADAIVEAPAPRRRGLPWLLGGTVIAAAAVVAIVVATRDRGDTPAPNAAAPAPTRQDVVAAAPVTPAAPPAAPAATTGSVELLVEPATAEVEIDEMPVELDHGRARVELDPGPHDIITVATGFRPLRRRVEVVVDQATPVEMRLATLARNERQPAKPKAKAKAKAKPADADAVYNPFAKKKAP